MTDVTQPVERTYSGLIAIRPRGEDDDALWLIDPNASWDPWDDEPLAGRVAEDIDQFGHTVTVSYRITDEPRTLDELIENEAKKLAGAADADYTQHGSDITGYLWTDAELNIGGHDLLAELSSAEGLWCLLVIRFGERDPSSR